MTVTIICAGVWLVAAVALCWANHRARLAAPTVQEPERFAAGDGTVWAPFLPPVPPPTRRPEPVCPLDLEGYALDSAFYGVLAPSFPEYH